MIIFSVCVCMCMCVCVNFTKVIEYCSKDFTKASNIATLRYFFYNATQEKEIESNVIRNDLLHSLIVQLEYCGLKKKF